MNEASSSVLIVADEWEPMHVLTARLQAEGGCQVRCVEQGKLDCDLTQFKAVFVYVHSVLAARVEDVLIDYALAGGRLIVLHHAIASAKVANPKWLEFLGIHIAPRDDPAYPWRVVVGTHTLVNLQPNHYITSHKVTYDRVVEYVPSDEPSAPGLYPALDLIDTEVFLNQHFTDGRAKTVLFGFQITDPQTGQLYAQDRSGWIKPIGQGWIFYLQPGHAATDFQHQSFGQIVLNCLDWEPGMDMAYR
ncbi:MAG: ThuA domain-containing protein [Caldilineaceae bacterium]